MKRVVAAVLIAAVAAAVAWFAHGVIDTTPRPAPAPASDALPPADPPRERDESRDGRASPPPRANGTLTTVAPAYASGVLTVVAPDGTTPVAGARVTFVGTAPSGSDAPPVLLATDAQGRVHLPKIERYAKVEVVHGRLRGSRGVERFETSWTVRLQESVSVAAVVRDTAGAPVGGVPVVLLVQYPSYEATERRATTAEDGTARFEVLPLPDGPDEFVRELAIALPLAVRVAAPFDLRAPPAEPLALTLLPVGRVVCEVRDAEGKAVADDRIVVLRRVPETRSRSDKGFHATDWDDVLVPLRDGRAEFPRVGLGVRLRVFLQPVALGFATSRRTFEGPRAAGEEVRVVLVDGAPQAVVTGRLVDADGVPQVGVPVVAELREPGALRSDYDESTDAGQSDAGTTDTDGRFRVSFDAPLDAVSGRTLRVSRRVQVGAHTTTNRLQAIVDLSKRLEDGETDVGDLVVPAWRILVEGVVLDAKGKPLEGAVVRAMEGPSSDRRRIEDADAAVTDADGWFELEGAEGPERISLGVDALAHYQRDEREFPAGTRGVRVVLAARARPTIVRVRLAPETPLPPAPFLLDPFLRRADPDGDSPNSCFEPFNLHASRGKADGNGGVAAIEVPVPGRYLVGVILWTDAVEHHTGAGVTTEPDPVFVTVPEDAESIEVVVAVDPHALEGALQRLR